MKLILSLILSFSTLFGGMFGAVAADASASDAPEPEAAAPAEAEAPASAMEAFAAATVRDALELKDRLPAREPVGDIDYAAMEYAHYDPEAFYADTDLLRELAKRGAGEAVDLLYDRLYDEFLYIDSLSVLAMLRYDADFYDEYWTEEYAYINTVWAETRDALYSACADVLDSPCAESFTEHVGEDTAQVFLLYEPLTQEELDNTDRELELIDEYNALYDSIDSLTYSFRGKEWTFDDLYGFRGDSLYWSDYDAYAAINDGLNRVLCETFSPLYIELVGIWTQTARSAGYDSYTDYAYDSVYCRDYTPEDAQRLCDAVKPIARAYYSDLYYSGISYDYDLPRPVFDGEELIAILGEYLPRVDARLTEPWTAMTEHGLYDIAPYGSGRHNGSYTTTMLFYRSPFLFVTTEDNCYDLTTVTHEFGHFSDFWFSPQTNVFLQVDDLDLSEIHSNALQALFTCFYGEIYDDGADIAEYTNLSYLLENIIEGCLYDEFQRRVLDDPEELTPEKLNDIHVQLCREYGLDSDAAWDGNWVYISHNFSSPLYYISYAASAIAALEIWDMAQADFDAAADVYMNVLSHGSYNEGYFEVLRECGLPLFTEEDAVSEVCRPVLQRLTDLADAYE